MSDTATLKIGNDTYTLPTIVGTEGERAIDVKPLRRESGHITLDPGFLNTGSCRSEITFIDGERGVLRYRGYPIEQLAEQSSFLEVAYLLTQGALPSPSALTEWEQRITRHTLVHEDMKRMYEAFPPNAHPMAILSAAVSALSTFYQDEVDPLDPDQVQINTIRLLAKVPTIAAFSLKRSQGHRYTYPDNGLSYAGRLLKMMFGYGTEPYELDEDQESALDKLLILHADHEQNCSTTTVRIVGSSKANLYASISSGISALWGPLHGGANQAVIEMLETIQNDSDGIDKYVRLARDKSSGFRLMGFGHRVYKSYDPRAKILKGAADKILAGLGQKDPLLDVARRLEEVALEDSYFREKNLYPNVDFYSGIIYRAMGIPVNMFTVMFALGRLPGWIAHWREGNEQGLPIGRPRQIYTGSGERPYVPVGQREE
ncbi:MAG: citrate synthase [Myxococcales bacterium FL481]|nr:MAG: citrate synthase [Myxococcales bacterium FL481]